MSSLKVHLCTRQRATPQRRWERDYWTRSTQQNTSNLWLISSVSACSLFMSCDPQAFNLWPGRPILTLRWLFQGSQLPLAWVLRTFLSSVARNAWLSHSWPLYSGLPSIFWTHTHTCKGTQLYKRTPGGLSVGPSAPSQRRRPPSRVPPSEWSHW